MSEAVIESFSPLAERLANALGTRAVITEADAREKYLVEERGLFRGEAAIVIVPETAADLAKAVAICAEEGVGMVPQGGNTGLVGGSVTSGREVLVSFEKMNRIREVDATNFTITVEAGAILADVQAAAAAQDCFFPLSLGAEGSCTIGGNIASNAGGISVLKYGNARDLTLGLEVVLPDGQIWDGMRPLYKDNSGYSLKNLFIGSEGSLGFVTAAVLKLYPRRRQIQTAYCALATVESALELLALARRRSGDQVTAFELMSEFSLSIVCAHADGQRPSAEVHPWYALIELSTSRDGDDLRATFEALLEEAFESGLISDAVVAETIDQAQRLWRLREGIPEAQKRAGGSIKHDISVPVSAIPRFIAEASQAVEAYMPGIHVCAFGHVGDGNVHYNLTQPDGMAKEAFLEHWEAVNDIVHPIAMAMNGSISAEHGIGLLKAQEIDRYRSKSEQALMRTIKRALDPRSIMNPGKTVAIEGKAAG
ncbi:FAD-binding oxidoreductase [Consotaella salsifontis]|uniref:4-phosphoerythronate dehydrogenase (FAD-dependent) n=1 Tax=Consotaella salsifontis TaxID=1365950 RepID=A0A1T4TCD7_9HYPH|nr:FAD-binding oxidoreductase [Consotaella salsifontis]SKA38001.1 4-phosphoerythronate dehydrogenase (FAD-dependent) [Consotaella salsifontis]